MQEKFTLKGKLMPSFLLAAFILLQSIVGSSSFAQAFCSNEFVLYTENFGAGTTPTSHPDIITTALTYQPDSVLFAEGVYRVINNTQQKPDWHNSPDHTGNLNGKMLVVNGNGNSFFSHIITSPVGFAAGYYSSSLFFMNVNRRNLCGARLLLPIVSFTLEYQAQDNSWVPLTGSPFSAAPVPPTPDPTWVQLGGVFQLPVTGSFNVQNIRLTLSDGITGGCGNDYALDDIKLATCPSGGPLPVEFLDVTAKQQGAGVSIDWRTSSETNNNNFDVEKSIDGGASWSLVSTTKANGNSAVVKKYNVYDSKPVGGENYYRVKQVDMDGNFKYSVTVRVKISIDKTRASVVTNPFINVIAVDFLSSANQRVSVTLYDAAGRSVATDRWVIPKGNSRKTFDKVNRVQKGVYILSITDENGSTVYKGKLIRQ